MRESIFTTLSFLAILGAQAAPLTPAEALVRLADSSAAGSPLRAPASAGLTLRQTVLTPANEPAVYVFGGADNSFYFVGADDRAEALLGYTDAPATGQMPPQLQWWLSEYAAAIASAPEPAAVAVAVAAAPAAPGMAAPMAARTIYAYIAPMLTTQWNQGNPYNSLCPTVNNQSCYTGCTATAAAQVMKYFNYPATGSGVKTYTPNSTATSSSGLYTSTLSLDMSTVNFDWANMIDNYETTSYSPEQATAVATLMKAVGYVSEMNYGVNSSGASASTTIAGFKQYFGYNDAAVSLQRDAFGRDAWEKMIYDNLRYVGPVLYSGFGLEAGGHAFVCDGYINGLFHINWGWGGSYNGYFRLSSLTPSGEGIGGNGSGDYSFDQSACLNVTKPDSPVISLDIPVVASSGNLKGTITDNHLIISTDGSYSKALQNLSSSTIKIYGGVKIVGEDNSVRYSGWIYSPSDLPTGYFFKNVEVNMANSSIRNLADGTYKVYLVAQVDGDETWVDVHPQSGCADHVLLTKSGSDYMVTNVEAPSLIIENLTVESSLYLFTDFRVSYDVVNNSGQEIADGVQPILYTKKSNAPAAPGAPARALSLSDVNRIATGDGVYVNLTDGERQSNTQTSAMTCYTSTVPSGQVYLGLKSSGSDKILAEQAVPLGNKPSAGSLNLDSFSYNGDANNVNAMRLKFNVGVNCTSGYYSSPVRVYIYPSGGGKSLASVNTQSIFLNSGQSTTTVASGSFPDAEIGATYMAIPYQLVNNSLSQLGSSRVYFKVGSVSAIETVADDSDAYAPLFIYEKETGTMTITAPKEIAAVEVYGVDGRRQGTEVSLEGVNATLTTGAVAPGMFIVRVILSDGTTFAEKFVK